MQGLLSTICSCSLRVGRESFHGTKELFILPPLILKARHLSGSAFCWIDIGLPEQGAEGFPYIGLGLVVEDRPTDPLCMMGQHAEMNVGSKSSQQFYSMTGKFGRQ